MLINQFSEKLRITRNDAGEPIIEARNGHVYDGFWLDKLGYWVETTRPNTTFKALAKRIPGIETAQLGEFESVFLVPITDFKSGLATLRKLGCHKVREYDAATLARFQEHGKALAEEFGFKKSVTAS